MRFLQVVPSNSSVSVILSQDELLEQKLKGMELSKPQRHHVSKIVEAYPKFEDSLVIELPTQEVRDLLGKRNIRDLREIPENLKKKNIHITLL